MNMLVLLKKCTYKPCSVSHLCALSMLLQGSESEHVGFSGEMHLQTFFRSEHVGFSREMRLQTLSVSQLFALSMLLQGLKSEHVGFIKEMHLQTLFSQSLVRIEHVASRFGK